MSLFFSLLGGGDAGYRTRVTWATRRKSRASLHHLQVKHSGKDGSLADDLNVELGIVSSGVALLLRPAEIYPVFLRFVNETKRKQQKAKKAGSVPLSFLFSLCVFFFLLFSLALLLFVFFHLKENQSISYIHKYHTIFLVVCIYLFL